MRVDLDTFLVALYTIVDDLYQAHCAPFKHRGGFVGELSDSEVLTLLCEQWVLHRDRAFLAYAARHLRPYFPRLLSQSAYNRRTRQLCGVAIRLIPLVAAELRAQLSPYQVFDGVPVPLARRCRGQRHKLFGDEAAIGHGGSDRSFYYGCELLLALAADGPITGFVLGPATTDERWLAEALLCWRCAPTWPLRTVDELPPTKHRGGRRAGPTGPLWPRGGVGPWSGVPYLADRAFIGADWQPYWRQTYGAEVLTKDRYRGPEAAAARRQHAARRQVVETINGHLEGVFGLAFPGARTTWGLLTRVAAKLLALNLGIWLNRFFGRPDFAFATLFPL